MTKPVNICPEHGTPMRTEPLTRFDGTQIGTLTIDVCAECDSQTEDDLDAFLARISNDDLEAS